MDRTGEFESRGWKRLKIIRRQLPLAGNRSVGSPASPATEGPLLNLSLLWGVGEAISGLGFSERGEGTNRKNVEMARLVLRGMLAGSRLFTEEVLTGKNYKASDQASFPSKLVFLCCSSSARYYRRRLFNLQLALTRLENFHHFVSIAPVSDLMMASSKFQA
ncbi:hypothetical protein CR513_52370, partial [Mucuna pruriens]